MSKSILVIDTPDEKWEDIKGYEGKYKVSSNGRIYSLLSNKILKGKIGKNGYCLINLSFNGGMVCGVRRRPRRNIATF